MKIFTDKEEFYYYILDQKISFPYMTIMEHITGYVEELNLRNGTDYSVLDVKHLLNGAIIQELEKENLICYI